MKEKLLAKLVAKYPGLPKQFLGLFADKLATKVTEESQIDTTIESLDNLPVSITDLAAEYQKEGDRRVTDFQKKNPSKTEPVKPEPGKTDPPAPVDDTPEWAKNLMKEVQTLKAEKTQTSMKSKLSEMLKDSKIPAKFYEKLPLPEKEEDLAAFAESIKTDHNEYKQSLIDEGVIAGSKTPAGGIVGGPAKGIDKDIENWANKGKVAVDTTKK
jgi:hypothetical protein